MNLRITSIICLLASPFLFVACTSQHGKSDRYFSESHRLPIFGVESYEPHWRKGNYIHYGKQTLLRVIHDQPGSVYASPRTILLLIDASPQTPNSLLAWLMLDDIYGAEIDYDQPPFNRPVYYLLQVNAQGTRSGLSGPYHKEDQRVSSLLNRKIDLTRAFPDEDFATQVITFIQDMKHLHGGKHRVYDNARYVMNWESMSRALLRNKQPELERIWPSSSLEVSDKHIYIWAPVRAAQGDYLGGYDGALSTGMSFDDGRITGLWIDMN